MDIDNCISQLRRGELLPDHTILELCFFSKSLLSREPNVLTLKSPVTVCGNIQGQFHDLLNIFSLGGFPPSTQYLFLGNYVGKGIYNVEVVSLLLLFKLKYPDKIHLIRGNFDTMMLSQLYGFYDECIRKYGSPRVWTLFTDVFNYLPVTAVINETMFCVHAGISQHLRTIDQISFCISRNCEITSESLMADLVWSDPNENIEYIASNNKGAGHYFGEKLVDIFCHVNNLNIITRAHQIQMEGFQFVFNKKVVTLWSAPNYGGRCGNLAAIMKVDEHTNKDFIVFGELENN
ncbi:serine/threonine protein phosphatase PP-X isozyme, putative [Entamoeba invadens IP1]|uniref:protein-serine/threonine phosphatase n=1 Tax=Entamoeba invadens IP1 TaxID=370355 RepID=L7FK46_ENTIV|nr:serine/threonine protein phosphatase PP-X isozyme, putative [Entamoeba invadens IP1]ELP86026.1 serine/threonine protein phosphatase PP-X isozyme, putative [Entamoeba invadens IP1]|eukprot:XP_004185372.1 serine/threonine protein phosphatase PP-X isozyme, putative [Entamoeba invadens IP1]